MPNRLLSRSRVWRCHNFKWRCLYSSVVGWSDDSGWNLGQGQTIRISLSSRYPRLCPQRLQWSQSLSQTRELPELNASSRWNRFIDEARVVVRDCAPALSSALPCTIIKAFSVCWPLIRQYRASIIFRTIWAGFRIRDKSHDAGLFWISPGIWSPYPSSSHPTLWIFGLYNSMGDCSSFPGWLRAYTN